MSALLPAAVGAAFLVAAGALVAVFARRPRSASAGDLRLHPLADGVYLYRGYFSNSAVLVLPNGVMVVDTQVSPLAARRLRAEIEKVTDRPIRWVVNTHYHGDHSGGNAVFPEAEIIATEETARFVHERDAERVEYARTFGLTFHEVHPTVPPTRTFRGELVLSADAELCPSEGEIVSQSLSAGGERIELRQLGRVETPDACIVWWPARGVIVSGDGVATVDYPYLGVPFLDEGLRDDGSWIGFLDAVRALRPSLLLPGHGPALVGERRIAERLDLLRALMTDLVATVKAELAGGAPLAQVIERADRKLGRWTGRKELRQYTVSQRFAIYRCINNLLPERKGKGWWDDLRPSVIRRAPRAEAERLLSELAKGSGRADAESVLARAHALAETDERPLAIALLETWTDRHPTDAAARAALADVLFDGARSIRPTVDATEYFVAAGEAARAALTLDPEAPLALLNLGALEIFGGMVLAQPMRGGIQKIQTALARGGLSPSQRAKAAFFLGKAHQMELRDDNADRWYREALPGWARWLYPVLRQRMRAFP